MGKGNKSEGRSEPENLQALVDEWVREVAATPHPLHEAPENAEITRRAIVRLINDGGYLTAKGIRGELRRQLGFREDGSVSSEKNALDVALEEVDRMQRVVERLQRVRENLESDALSTNEENLPQPTRFFASEVGVALDVRHSDTWTTLMERWERRRDRAREETHALAGAAYDRILTLDILDELIDRYVSAPGQALEARGSRHAELPKNTGEAAHTSGIPLVFEPYYESDAPYSDSKVKGKWDSILRWIMNRVAKAEAMGYTQLGVENFIHRHLKMEMDAAQEAVDAGLQAPSLVGGYLVDENIVPGDFSTTALKRLKKLHESGVVPGKLRD